MASSEEASGFFDKLVGPGREHIDPNVPKADLAKLRTRTARIVRFATNELAHYNEAKGTFADGLTLGDLHGAISLIVDLSVIGSDMSETVGHRFLASHLRTALDRGRRPTDGNPSTHGGALGQVDGESLTEANFTL